MLILQKLPVLYTSNFLLALKLYLMVPAYWSLFSCWGYCHPTFSVFTQVEYTKKKKIAELIIPKKAKVWSVIALRIKTLSFVHREIHGNHYSLLCCENSGSVYKQWIWKDPIWNTGSRWRPEELAFVKAWNHTLLFVEVRFILSSRMLVFCLDSKVCVYIVPGVQWHGIYSNQLPGAHSLSCLISKKGKTYSFWTLLPWKHLGKFISVLPFCYSWKFYFFSN